MKQLLLSLFVISITANLFAQNDQRFRAAMQATMVKFGEAKTPEDYQTMSNAFQRIAENETERWEPLYYQAFAKTLEAFDSKEKEATAAQLEELEPKLDALLELADVKDNKAIASEIHALKSMLLTARMSVNPMVLGAKLGPISSKQLEIAQGLNENNPRVYLLMAQSLFYTPEAFGGNKVLAKELAEKALSLFNTEEESQAEGLLPRWGKGQVEGLLKQMK